MNSKILLLAFGFILHVSAANAEQWGEMGYTTPTINATASDAADAAVASPQAMQAAADDAAAGVTTVASSAETTTTLAAPEAPSNDSMVSSSGKVTSEDISPARETTAAAKPSARSEETTTNVSTVQNTYGVETQANPGVKLFVSPYGGVTSSFGNTTVNTDPQYSAGASVGLLISDNMMVNASYTYAVQNVSNPLTTTTFGTFGNTATNVFSLKTNSFDAGVKLFFLGRESKIRPFLGGGFGYAKSFLNYQSGYLSTTGNQGQTLNDFTLNQVTGYGELGVEYAFTSTIVASLSGRLDGVISSKTSGTSDANANLNYDANKLAAGNSLSRTASYAVALGVGFYF